MFTGDWHLFLEEVHKWRRDRVRAPAMPPAKSPKWKSRACPTGGKDTALQEKSDVFPLYVAVFQFVYYQRLGKNKLSVYDGAALGSILPNRKACKHFT